jgi:O-antigen ligase
MFTVVPLSLAVNDLRVTTVSYTAIVAAFTGVISITLVLLYQRVSKPAARAAVPFVALIAWMIGSLLIDGTTRQGAQFIVVQIAFVGALLLASTARRRIGGRLDIMVARCIRFTSIVLIGLEGYGAGRNVAGIGPRAEAIVSLVCMSWFLSEYRLGNRTSLWWSLASLLGIAISLSRIALFAGIVIFLATMFFAPGKRRFRNVTICVLVVAAGIWAITSWAPLKDRFTQGDLSLSVGGIEINAEGRSAVWAVVWSGVQNDPLIGHGPGSASVLSDSVNPSFDHPHNDYLLVLYDFGVIGLVLFAWFSMRSVKLLWRARKSLPGLIPAAAALNAGLAVLIVMTTDNPLDYPMVMIPLGALIGLGLGAMGQRGDKLHPPTRWPFRGGPWSAASEAMDRDGAHPIAADSLAKAAGRVRVHDDWPPGECAAESDS